MLQDNLSILASTFRFFEVFYISLSYHTETKF